MKNSETLSNHFIPKKNRQNVTQEIGETRFTYRQAKKLQGYRTDIRKY